MSERLDQTLAELSILFASEGDLVRSAHLEQTRAALRVSTEAACAELASNAYWGGPGAMWETVFSKEWQPPGADGPLMQRLRQRTDTEVAAANRKLASLTVALAEEFSTVCERCVSKTWVDRASHLGRVQRDWLSKGIL